MKNFIDEWIKNSAKENSVSEIGEVK